MEDSSPPPLSLDLTDRGRDVVARAHVENRTLPKHATQLYISLLHINT